MSVEEQGQDAGDAVIRRRRVLQAAAGAGVASAVWSSPSIHGIAMTPAYAGTISNPDIGTLCLDWRPNNQNWTTPTQTGCAVGGLAGVVGCAPATLLTGPGGTVVQSIQTTTPTIEGPDGSSEITITATQTGGQGNNTDWSFTFSANAGSNCGVTALYYDLGGNATPQGPFNPSGGSIDVTIPNGEMTICFKVECPVVP